MIKWIFQTRKTPMMCHSTCKPRFLFSRDFLLVNKKTMDIFSTVFVWVLLTLAVVSVGWVWKSYTPPKPPAPVPIPVMFSPADYVLLTQYFQEKPKPTPKLQDEWTDCTRNVSEKYAREMLERCFDNDTPSARAQVILCVFYKMVNDWNTKKTGATLTQMINLLVLVLAMRSDGYRFSNRTDLMVFDLKTRMLKLKSTEFIREMKPRIQVMVDRNYMIEGAEKQLTQPDTMPFLISVNAFLFVMLETYIKQIPASFSNCSLCVKK